MKVYLAIPYSGNEEESFFVANKVSALMMKKDIIVFSPISHSHPMAIQEGTPGDWAFWEKFDRSFIEWADEVHVVVIGKDGQKLIDKSTGVKAEMKIAEELGKPVRFYQYEHENKEFETYLVNSLS
jgi:hypothetical protein